MILNMTLRGQPLMVYKVESEAEALQGLQGCPIDDDEALLLPGDRGLHTFNVPHALDIVWVDNAGKTLAIDERVAPSKFVSSKGPNALELRGGWFQRHPVPQATTGQPCCADCAMRHAAGTQVNIIGPDTVTGASIVEHVEHGTHQARMLHWLQQQDPAHYGMHGPHGPLTQITGQSMIHGGSHGAHGHALAQRGHAMIAQHMQHMAGAGPGMAGAPRGVITPPSFSVGGGGGGGGMHPRHHGHGGNWGWGGWMYPFPVPCDPCDRYSPCWDPYGVDTGRCPP